MIDTNAKAADLSAFHTISIRVPVPANSRAKQYPIIAKYERELEALRAKLPEGHEFRDTVVEPRTNERKPRESVEDKVARGVAEELAKRQAAEGQKLAAE